MVNMLRRKSLHPLAMRAERNGASRTVFRTLKEPEGSRLDGQSKSMDVFPIPKSGFTRCDGLRFKRRRANNGLSDVQPD